MTRLNQKKRRVQEDKFVTMFFSTLLLLLASATSSCHAYFADWSALTRDREPLCVDIPANLSLCANIGYTKMRLPNLLDHDTLHEVSDQARSWVPLLNVGCHPDTQLFLCSLFAPVCLERPIYPCRSLCNKVKSGCVSTMTSHGYPWPKMLECEKFPVDNDMCITSQSERDSSGNHGDDAGQKSALAEVGNGGDDGGASPGEYRWGRKVDGKDDYSANVDEEDEGEPVLDYYYHYYGGENDGDEDDYYYDVEYDYSEQQGQEENVEE